MQNAYRLDGASMAPPAQAAPTTAPWRPDIPFWLCVFAAVTFTQWYVMVVMGPGNGGAEPQSSASNPLSGALRAVFFPIYLIILGLIAMRPLSFAKAMLRSWLLLALLLIAVASTTWSIQPDVTVRRLVAILFTTFAGVLFAERFEWPKTLEILGTAFAVVVVMSFAFAILPGYGIMQFDFPGAWRGVYGGKNQLGYAMSLGTPILAACAVANPQRRRLWAGFAFAALALIVLSTSKTALLSCMMGLAFFPLIWLCRRGLLEGTVGIFATVAGLALIGSVLVLAPEFVFKLIGRDATFTGRTLIWEAVQRQIAHNPIFGYGYGAVWDDQSGRGPVAWISHDQGFTIFSAHYTVPGLWLELGLIGVIAWVALLGGSWLKALSRINTAPAYFCLPFLVIFTLHSLTEADALIQNDMGWVILSMTATKLAMGWRSAPEEAEAAPPLTDEDRGPEVRDYALAVPGPEARR